MSHYHDYYEDEEQDEYPTDGQPVRTRTSTRHYQPTTRTRIVDQYNDDEYEYVPATRRLPITEPHQRIVPARRTASRPPRTQPPVEQPPVPRQRTYQPPVQTTRQPQEMSRRSFLGITRRGLFQTAAVVGGFSLVGLGLWGRSKYIHVQGQLEEGQYAAKPLSLVCGHNDSATHKTQLHAYIQPDDGKINFIELPGGNAAKAKLNQTQSVREAGYQGDLSDLYLTINPVPVGEHKYQIHLHVEMHAVAVFPGTFGMDWILVDNNKGYFEVVNSK